MIKRKIKWSSKAVGQRQLISDWYQTTLGDVAVKHFNNDVNSTVDSLVSMPTIGRIDLRYSTDRSDYYSFIFHKRYSIVYRFTSRTLYIIAFRATQMI